MEFVKKNKYLAAMLLAAAAIVIQLVVDAVISLLIPSTGRDVTAIILSYGYSYCGMYLAGLLFYKCFLKTELPSKLLLIFSAIYAAVVLIVSFVFRAGALAPIGFLASVAAAYIAAQQLLKRTVFGEIPADGPIFGKAAATAPAEKSAEQKAAATEKKNNIVIAIFAILLVVLMAKCVAGGSSGSSSGRKWSDLNDTEKANAKWAYEVQQAINGQK